jgi:hypothetical protein
MLEILGLLVGNIFSGGATGLIGMVAQRWADFKNKQLDLQLEKMKFDNAIELRKVDAQIMAQEWAARTKVAEVEAAGKEAVADAAAFGESYKLEPQRYSDNVKPTWGQGWLLVILDFIRGIIRPGLTIYLCAITTMVYLQVRMLLGGEDLSAAAALDAWKMVVGTLLYLTTTCVVWWYGTRNKNAAPKVS